MTHPNTDAAIRATAGEVWPKGDGSYVSKCGRTDIECLYCRGALGHAGRRYPGRLCQHGARTMADRGAGYRDILAHYYGGVTVSEPLEPRGFDREGREVPLATLRAKYGFTVRRAINVAPGQEVFRVIALREKSGPATLVVRSTVGGRPDVGRRVAFAWPDAPPQQNTGRDWGNRYVIGETNANGDVGFGLGTGAYIRDVAVGGPHSVWVWSPSASSDAVFGLGMLGGTNHDHVDVEFALVQEAAVGIPSPVPPTVPPPSEPVPPTTLVERIRNRVWNAVGQDEPIPYNPSAAFPTKARELKLGAPLTREYDVDGFRCQGYAWGILYARIGDWANILVIDW